jgi:hypothetical protein
MDNDTYLPIVNRRRTLLKVASLGGMSLVLAACQRATDTVSPATAQVTTSSNQEPVQMSLALKAEVWKTPSCGCCKAWVEHLQREGFTVQVNDVQSTGAVRTKLGIPDDMGSCHTALIGGFAVEGHVPAREIKRLLTEQPSFAKEVVGLSAPGMPVGSPGMETDGKRDKYDVMLVLKNGQHRVYQSYV